MRNSTVRFVLALLLLVFGGAFEEFLPKMLGVGFPVLLSLVPILAIHDPLALPVLFALSAGFMEDALSSLPFLASPSYFLLVVVLIRVVRFPLSAVLITFPLYQIWICLWTIGIEGSVFTRVLLSIPMGAMTMLVLVYVIGWLERKVAADEAD